MHGFQYFSKSRGCQCNRAEIDKVDTKSGAFVLDKGYF
jgi:hypothetical protein